MIDLDTFDEGQKECVIAETIAAHPITVNEEHLLAIVLNHLSFPSGYVALLNREEVQYLRTALEMALADLALVSHALN
jgi:hypothetical protein